MAPLPKFYPLTEYLNLHPLIVLKTADSSPAKMTMKLNIFVAFFFFFFAPRIKLILVLIILDLDHSSGSLVSVMD